MDSQNTATSGSRVCQPVDTEDDEFTSDSNKTLFRKTHLHV